MATEDPKTDGTAPLLGHVERVTFHNEENGYSVLRVRIKGHADAVTLTGSAPHITAGEHLEASGEWIEDPQYGRQFKATSLKTTPPDSLEGVEKYLASGLIEGIGPVYAKRIVEHFGKDTLEIIENSSAKLEAIDGIGPKRRNEIKDSWAKQKAIQGIMVFLHEHGISTSRALRIHKEYGDEALEMLQENPYKLAQDLHGIGFHTADQIAQNLGVGETSPARIRAGIVHLLEQAAGNGHCALPHPNLLNEAAELLGAAEEAIQSATDQLTMDGDLVSETRNGQELIYLAPQHKAEVSIARCILERSSTAASYPPIDADRALAWAEKEIGHPLAEGQREAIRSALKHRLLIITGGPGVGKTTVLNSLLKILTTKGVSPVLAAPTGRAAKRLSESTGVEALTLHRLLEYQPATGWGRHPDRPLEGQLFVVDEVSMVDALLMQRLLEALPPEAHLILVGDADQLPSVGAGNVLADLLQSNTVPTAHLTEVYRQAAKSLIISAARSLNAGHLPDAGSGDEGEDFFFFQREDPETIRETMVDLLTRKLPERFQLDPLHEVQVLTPMNRNSLGTESLNALLQSALNPPSREKRQLQRFGTTFRAGDKVIQTRNNYEKEVFNGDIGRVVEIREDPDELEVQFDAQRSASYALSELDELKHAFAITIHKSQGSEFPCVIVPVSSQHYLMLQRNLFYTGITRGRSLVILVGQKSALRSAAQQTGSLARHTALASRLKQGKTRT